MLPVPPETVVEALPVVVVVAATVEVVNVAVPGMHCE